LQRQARREEAQQAYERAFAAFRQSQSEKTAEFAKLITNSGLLSFETGRFGDAATKHRRAWEIQSALPDVDDRERAFTLNNLALALVQLDQLSEAESLFRKAIALQKNDNISKPNLNSVETLNNLAVLEKNTGRPDAAEQHEQEALQLAARCLGRDDKVLASIWNNQGTIAVERKDFRAAKELFEKAAELWVRTSGPDSPDYASALSNLAGLEAKQGHRKEAQALFSTALRIDEAHLGPNHPKVAADLGNLAAQRYCQKNLNESIALYERAGAIEEKTYGPGGHEVGRTWRNLAIVYQVAKQYPAAGKAYGKAIHAFEISPGPDSPELLSCLRDYAGLLRKLERFGEAEQAEVRASGIQVRNAIKAEKLDTHLPAGLTFQD
jgi:tetratricopeptide (TPR) repeat protein